MLQKNKYQKMAINDYKWKKLYEECGTSDSDSSSSSKTNLATPELPEYYKSYSSSKMTKKEKILRVRKSTGIEAAEAEGYLDENDWDINDAISAIKGGKKKKPKDKKIFKVGDIIVCIDPKPGKLPADCVDFLMTYKKFKVLDVNEKYNIDLGHKLVENDNPYFFSPNRFELMNGIAPVMKSDGTIVESGKETPQPEAAPSAGKAGGQSKMDELKKKMGGDVIGKTGKVVKPFSDFADFGDDDEYK